MSPFSMFASSSVTLAWSPSISTNVVGYKVYYGLTSGAYCSTNFVTRSTNVTVTGLTEGTKYYFAATAVDTHGMESQFSNETAYQVPTNSTSLAATLAAVAPPANGQFALAVNGVAKHKYVIQVSTNLVDWTSVATNIAPFTYVDVNAGQFSRRFYRSYYLP